jgi:hypothetical protein
MDGCSPDFGARQPSVSELTSDLKQEHVVRPSRIALLISTRTSAVLRITEDSSWASRHVRKCQQQTSLLTFVALTAGSPDAGTPHVGWWIRPDRPHHPNV